MLLCFKKQLLVVNESSIKWNVIFKRDLNCTEKIQFVNITEWQENLKQLILPLSLSHTQARLSSASPSTTLSPWFCSQ